MWSTVLDLISLQATNDNTDIMKIRPCRGWWAYCKGDCENCQQEYSDRTEESEWKQYSTSTNGNT